MILSSLTPGSSGVESRIVYPQGHRLTIVYKRIRFHHDQAFNSTYGMLNFWEDLQRWRSDFLRLHHTCLFRFLM